MLKIVIYHDDYRLPIKDVIPKLTDKVVKKTAGSLDESRERSIRRTREKISDIIACNRFDLWATFTFRCKRCIPKCDNKPCTCTRDSCKRFDPWSCKRMISTWLNRQTASTPGFRYIIVPEFHKNGAVHFHAFMSRPSSPLKFTGRMDAGKKVYKFSNYTMGITHVIDISEANDDEHNSIANYMQKYITKDMPLFPGKKRYFVSQNLTRPVSVVNGVQRFQLQNVIKGKQPVYINDTLEVQIHPIVGLKLDKSMQNEFDLLDVAVRDSVAAPRSRRPLAFPSH